MTRALRPAPAADSATFPLRRLQAAGIPSEQRALVLAREWLVTNGLGGYASGTIGGPPSRRYHGLLVAALPPPHGRRLTLSDANETVVMPDGRNVPLTTRELARTNEIPLEDFRLEAGLPIWRYGLGKTVLERRVVMPHGQNTTFVLYEIVAGSRPVMLEIALGVQHRSHDAPVDSPLPAEPRVARVHGGYEIAIGNLAPLRLLAEAGRADLMEAHAWIEGHRYAIEESRGYVHTSRTWSPGHVVAQLEPGRPLALVASTEPWEVITALDPHATLEIERERRLGLLAVAPRRARRGLAAELVLAADQFIVTPVGRDVEAARVRASGEDERSVIAGYHWFTDWGRDTMISLEGLTLCTGRAAEAKRILMTFAASIRDGLLPNLFPEGDDEGLYHTADATLWLFHAIDRYVATTNDRVLLEGLLPQLLEVAERHLEGTRFGIGVDPNDGLLRQGAPGYQLTWMDAKVGGWVVTPRRGKAVEINALWYNAMRLLAGWLRDAGRDAEAQRYDAAATRAQEAFNRRFWNASLDHLYDVVDGESGDDASCRPNQVLAISLRHPVLASEHWRPVLQTVRRELLTPYGLRTLSPTHPDYQPRYHGDLRSRDAAYHQGTVWPWLIGPFTDAWRRAYPEDTAFTRDLLAAFDAHLSDACVGTISEIFDAEPPFDPRGAAAQAWSVAEVLRCTHLGMD